MWKTCKWYRPCAKRVFKECSNMAYLVYHTQNLQHNQAKWSFNNVQRNKIKLNRKSACRTLPLFKRSFWGSFEMKSLKEEKTWKLCRALSTVTKSGRIPAQRCLWTMEHIFPDLFRDSSKWLRALFVAVNSLSTIVENGLQVILFERSINGSCYLRRPLLSLQSRQIFLNIICSFIKHFLVFVDFSIQKRWQVTSLCLPCCFLFLRLRWITPSSICIILHIILSLIQ